MPRTTRLTPRKEADTDSAATPSNQPSKLLDMLADPAAVNKAQRPIRPQAPFMWAVAPQRLTVRNGKVIPSLIKQTIEPGKHGVTRLRSGRLDISGMVTNCAARGQQLIGWDVDEYCVELAPGYYASKFETLNRHTGQTVWDEQAFVDWLCDLMDRGVIPRPSKDAIGAVLSVKRTERQHLVGKPGVEHMTTAIEAEIAALEAAMMEAQ